MNNMVRINGLLAILLLAAAGATAQAPPVDGFYKYEVHKNAKPIPLPEVNKNNINFYKRVYKDIDLTHPKNGLFTIPGATLIEIIMKGIEEGKITAYSAASTPQNPTGDAFTEPLTYQQAMGTMTDSVLVPIFDDEGNQVDAVMKMNDFNPAAITKFRVKEDIFYDKQRSRIETRIIGLAPLHRVEAAGELLNEQPTFWLYFPDCRDVFVTVSVSDQTQDIQNMNFDDIFLQQRFHTTIVKEASPTNEKAENPNEIEEEIKDYKKETWEY